jgi:hypothetical protein
MRGMKVILYGIFFVVIGVAGNCYAAEGDLTGGASPGMGITSGRARALMRAGIGLISVVCGGLAVARSKGVNGTGKGRVDAIAALVLGVIGVLLSVVHLGGSTGFGTGGGRAGAIVALVLGLIGVSLGGLAAARSRLAGSDGRSLSADE